MRPTVAVKYEDTLKHIEEMKAEGALPAFERGLRDVINPITEFAGIQIKEDPSQRPGVVYYMRPVRGGVEVGDADRSIFVDWPRWGAVTNNAQKLGDVPFEFDPSAPTGTIKIDWRND